MATTVVNYAGDGSTTQFTYSFDSLADTYVATKVTNETSVDITGNYTVSLDYDTSTVTITPAPAVGYTVEIKRATSTADDLFNFPAGTVMKPSDLEMALKTVRDYAEESADQISLQVDTISSAAIDDATSTALAYRDQAGTYATNANTALVGAQLAETNTQAILDEFKGLYLGSHVSNSAANIYAANNGYTLNNGDLYFDSTNVTIKVYQDGSWLEATSTAAATAAQAAQTAAEAARDEFKEAFLGSHLNEAALNTYVGSSAYTIDTGDLYYDETVGALRVYNGSAWVAAASEQAAIDAQTAQTAAEAARDATLTVEAQLYDLYLGQFANDAAVDTYIAGQTTTSYTIGIGDLYFNTTTGAMKVYNGSAWVDVANASTATAAATSEANAATSEANAATSATNAATSETNAATSASAANTHKLNAQTAEANAEAALASFQGIWFGTHTNVASDDAEVGAYITSNSYSLGAGDLYFDTTNGDMKVYNGSAWVISTSQTYSDAAATSATNAATSETNAGNSATAAANSATAASASETAAANSATASANSATAASTSETNAATSATNAGTSETNAASSASAAATSATNAGTSETNAASSASAAATSATNAGTSETNAASSASAAATSATNAQNVLNQFNDRYLGSHTNVASDDAEVEAYITGDANITKDAGDIYYDSTNSVLKYYTVASGWLPAAATTVIDTSNLGNVGNVTITAVSTGDIIEWNGSQWVNVPNFSGSYNDLTNKPTIPANAGDLGDVTITAAATGEVLKFNGAAWVDANVDYSELTGVPSTFAPSAHTHAISEVTNLQTELDGKAATGHTHAVNDLTDVTITAAATGEVLRYNGSAWVDAQLAYGDLSGTPSLATVATTGAYSDLTGAPTIPSNIEDLTNVTVTAAATGEVLRYDGAAWVDAVLNYSDLAGTPTLATVATSGSYNDLADKPTIPANVGDLGDVTITAAATGEVLRYNGTAWVDAQLAYGDLSGTPTLATVATSGAYADLSGTPTLGTAAAAATTDFATAAQGTTADTAVQPNTSPTFVTVYGDTVELERASYPMVQMQQTGANGTGQFAMSGDNFQIRNAGTAGEVQVYSNNTKRMTVKHSGQLALHNYTGAGTHTGIAVKSLAVDNVGNVIEEPLGATTGKAIAMAIVFGG